MSESTKALLASWARSFAAAAVAVYVAGVTDPKAILIAGVSAVLPVIQRWLNPNDPAFGKGSK